MEVHKSRGVNISKGFESSGIHCGLRSRNSLDIAMIKTDNSQVSAVFTQNIVKAAPVIYSMSLLEKKSNFKAIVINSKNANACTGKRGIEDTHETAKIASKKLKCNPDDILVMSTGIIGQFMDMGKISKGIELLVDKLSNSIDSEKNAAKAIMTTDTVPKEIAVSIDINGITVNIGGMAKGSGMVHPNMATTLGFITSDINIDYGLQNEAFKEAIDVSFNMISVDGDTSTNDSVFLMSNGLSGNEKITSKDKNYKKFKEALIYVLCELAKMVARDGEGATKLIETKVLQARTYDDAKLISKAIVASSLVKSAIFGKDANWGRVVCAAGYSGANFNPDKISLYIGNTTNSICLMHEGSVLDEDIEESSKILEESTVIIKLLLNDGVYNATAWGCDLSYDYVKINAEYRS